MKIHIENQRILTGRVPLSDVAVLANGIQRALSAQLRRALGYEDAGRSPDDIAHLADLDLVGIEGGSTVLVCEPAQPKSGRGGDAAAIGFAVRSLRDSVDRARTIGRNHGLAPAASRALVNGLDRITKGGGQVKLLLGDGSGDLVFDHAVLDQVRTDDVPDQIAKVIMCGKLSRTDKDDLTIWVRHGKHGAKTKVRFSAAAFDKIDKDLRWGFAQVTAVPSADNPRNLVLLDPKWVEPASESDPLYYREISKAEQLISETRAKDALAKIASFQELKRGWNEYGAEPIARFARLAASQMAVQSELMAERAGWQLPRPFVVPTTTGGVQFEWEVDGRAVELEIDRSTRRTLLLAGEIQVDIEDATPWDVFAALHWLVLGVRP